MALGLATVITACACNSNSNSSSNSGSKADVDAKTDADSQDSSATKANGEHVEGPLPRLRSGDQPPAEAQALTAALVARHDVRGVTYAEVKFVIPPDANDIAWDPLHLEIDGLVPGQIAAIDQSGDVTILLRSAAGKTIPKQLRGALYGSRWQNGRRIWTRFPFSATTNNDAIANANQGAAGRLPQRWVNTVRDALVERGRASAERPTHPWEHFAAARLQLLFGGTGGTGGTGGLAAAQADARRPRTDLVRLMDTTSGILSIQEALQHDRGLRLRSESGPAKLPISEISGPPLAEHPFAAMQAQLPVAAELPPEKLAAAAPADFWYARFESLPLFLRLLGEADRWVTPLVQLLQQNPEDRRLTLRYETQLGVVRGELAKILGPAAVGQVAVVGSDPYIREGTDITLIFEIRQATLFNAEIDRYLQQHTSRIEALGSSIETRTRDHQGVTITSTLGSKGQLRQERAMVGDLALLSNSPRAIERVLDTIAGRHARLSESADFRYMRARDPGSHQFTAFLSDSLIAASIGPAQKIQASRRERALAELLVPGYAALLYGWLYGQTPVEMSQLFASDILNKGELRHSNGDAIDFSLPRLIDQQIPPDQTTRSLWGTPSTLTPIIDLPPLLTVTHAEASAYRDFSRSYQNYWKRVIDPVRISLDITPVPGHPGAEVLDIDMRVLPLIDATDYRDIEEIVGTSRVEVKALGDGVQAIWAVGETSSVRNDLDGLLRAASGQSDLGIGWVGDWVMLGALDRVAIAELFAYANETVQLPDPAVDAQDPFGDDALWIRLGKTPVFAAAAVKSNAALVATLSGIRTLVNEVAPGTVIWGQHSTYRDLPIVRIGVRPDAPMVTRPALARALALYYVQTSDAFVVALDPSVLHVVVDRLLADETPKPGPDDGAQLIFEASSSTGKAMWTVGSWMLQSEAITAQRVAERAAEIIMLGAPGADGPALLVELGYAYFGATPLSARGSPSFLMGNTGAGDPAFGTQISRVFPELPLAGSPVQGLMERLAGIRIEVAFDKEPAAAGPDARSLHTHLKLDLRAP